MTNLDGDGKLWVAELSIRSSDNMPVLFAYDPSNGEPHKTFSIEMPGFVPHLGSGIMPIACDINSDGKMKLLSAIKQVFIASGTTLVRPQYSGSTWPRTVARPLWLTLIQTVSWKL